MRSINKILIANRGEIALRIIKAAHELGISTVCIFTDEDADASWIRESNESWPLGAGSISDTYLNSGKIIGIAIESHADAIHPGYGFLSENYLFAKACLDNHIVFIGPSPEVLRLMGDKTAAQNWVKKMGIPVPWNLEGAPDDLIARKETIPYPVMVKAAAGGGGKGMRLVHGPDQLDIALHTTSDEALQFFGDKRVFLENYIDHARHVEVQILGDQHGNLVHLYERDCSVQRRHQKLIEESPSETSPEILRTLINSALQIASSIHYTGAGTVEFLVERNGKYFFLEMNPRIQVEHGVTELVTGIDIVKEQIRIAEGKSLSVIQDNIKPAGHAIEARIYAEDAENDLLPSPGYIEHMILPKIPGIRIDTAAGTGTSVSGNFDPLIAKLLVHSSSREKAVNIMQDALQAFAITGITQNLHLLHIVFRDSLYLSNEVSTRYLSDRFQTFTQIISAGRKSNELRVLFGLAISLINDKTDISADSPWTRGYWRNSGQIRFRKGSSIIELEYESKGKDTITFYYKDETHHISSVKRAQHQLEFILNNESVKLYLLPEKDGNYEISDGHLAYVWKILSPDPVKTFDVGEQVHTYSGDTVIAPQPGTIMEIKVSEGQLVNRGDYLLTIESMKLENTIMATREGLIKKIAIKAGDKVKKDEPLIYLQGTNNN